MSSWFTHGFAIVHPPVMRLNEPVVGGEEFEKSPQSFRSRESCFILPAGSADPGMYFDQRKIRFHKGGSFN